ncbi:hypothetical protein [Euryhalocaulis caribicus]|uniref:hypothetical protein n=1 Tax=Euryhalocaulis caribicus TaxID=1161401 RepID=UPI0012695ADE|nr:hypothetical protein [Euryhalocaulis caribicus]
MSRAKRQLSAMAKDHAEAALETLVSIARDGGAPAAARVSASTAILDRAYGKPVQALNLGGEVKVKTLADFYGQSGE